MDGCVGADSVRREKENVSVVSVVVVSRRRPSEHELADRERQACCGREGGKRRAGRLKLWRREVGDAASGGGLGGGSSVARPARGR